MTTGYKIKIIKYLLTLGAVILVLWLINLNFPRDSRQVLELDFFSDQPMISKPGPGDRLRSEDGLLTFLSQPVYFNVRSLPWFDRARIAVVYRERGYMLEGLGAQTGPGFSYQVFKPISMNESGEYREAIFDLDLEKLYSSKNIRRFMITTRPKADASAGLFQLKSVKVILNR